MSISDNLQCNTIPKKDNKNKNVYATNNCCNGKMLSATHHLTYFVYHLQLTQMMVLVMKTNKKKIQQIFQGISTSKVGAH